MKAIVCTAFGTPDVLQLRDVTQPVPKADEVLVRIRASSVNFGDRLARNFKAITPGKFSMPLIFWLPSKLTLGFNTPRFSILGNEFSGIVEAVGDAVTTFKPGDAVFGYRSMNFGTYAEYVTIKASGMIAHKPTTMSHEEAATVPYGALTALTLLRKVNIRPGQKVLIIGASGAIGSYAVQLAKHFGAHVTGVCGTERVAFVQSLGADRVIDYQREDFTTTGQTYDLIFDVPGKGSFGRVKRSLTATGVYMRVSFKMKHLLQMLWTARFGGRKVVCALSNETPADLRQIRDWVETGTITTRVDKRFPLAQTADAHRYIEAGRREGHVVVTV